MALATQQYCYGTSNTVLLWHYSFAILAFWHNVMHGLMLWSVNNSRKRRRPDRNVPGGRPGKKKVTEMDLVAFQKKGGLTVTVQCTAVRTQSNLVIGTSWCLVVLGGAW